MAQPNGKWKMDILLHIPLYLKSSNMRILSKL